MVFVIFQIPFLVVKGMKKSSKIVLILAAIGIIVGVTVGSYIVDPFGLNLAGFYWEVEIGDSYLYLVEALIEDPYSMVHEEDIFSASFNGTTINVTVSNLPSLSDVFTRSQFTYDVIQSIKVDWKVSNSTAYIGSTSILTDLISAFSECILPCGAWSLLDQLYPDTLATPSLTYFARLSILYGDTFQTGYRQIGYDDTLEYLGNVSLTTGVPSSIEWSYRHNTQATNVTLTLIE